MYTNEALIEDTQEHIIVLQDQDVQQGTRQHERTLMLLREAVKRIPPSYAETFSGRKRRLNHSA